MRPAVVLQHMMTHIGMIWKKRSYLFQFSHVVRRLLTLLIRVLSAVVVCKTANYNSLICEGATKYCVPMHSD